MEEVKDNIHIDKFNHHLIKMPLTPIPMSLLESFTPTEAIAKIVLLINCILEHIATIDDTINNLDNTIEETASKYAKQYLEEYKPIIKSLVDEVEAKLDREVQRLDDYIYQVDTDLRADFEDYKQEYLQLDSIFLERNAPLKDIIIKLESFHNRPYAFFERDAYNYTWEQYDNAELTWDYYDTKNYTFI